MIFSVYTNRSFKDVIGELNTSENGLTKKEALLAQQKYGFNEIKIKNINAFEVFVRQLKSPFAFLLLIAALISIFIGQAVDSIAVLAFIVINVSIGFFQEYKAERSVILLQKFIYHKIKVLRDGKEELIDRKFLVPGDIVLLEAGDIVPADLRVINVENFSR